MVWVAVVVCLLSSAPMATAASQAEKAGVQWLAWGEKALDKAKVEHKLILLSVSDPSCHWFAL